MKGPIWEEPQTTRDEENRQKIAEFETLFIAVFGKDAYDFLKGVRDASPIPRWEEVVDAEVETDGDTRTNL